MSKLWLMYQVLGVLWVVGVLAILFCPIPSTKVSAPQPNVEITQPTPVVPEEVQPAPTEDTLVREDIPLDEGTQRLLYQACEQMGIQYELALAVIWQETDFRNITGDGGDSIGYMQVQPRWHSDRMERLGVTDLSDPYSNFLVGCDYLAELIARDKGLEWALMAYNGGPTYANEKIEREMISQYAKNVLNYLNTLKTEERKYGYMEF